MQKAHVYMLCTLYRNVHIHVYIYMYITFAVWRTCACMYNVHIHVHIHTLYMYTHVHVLQFGESIHWMHGLVRGEAPHWVASNLYSNTQHILLWMYCLLYVCTRVCMHVWQESLILPTPPHPIRPHPTPPYPTPSHSLYPSTPVYSIDHVE